MDFRMIGVPWGLFLFLIFKDFIHKALVLLVVLICGRIVKLLQQFFLLPRQILWHFDGHPNKLVTSTSVSYTHLANTCGECAQRAISTGVGV